MSLSDWLSGGMTRRESNALDAENSGSARHRRGQIGNRARGAGRQRQAKRAAADKNRASGRRSTGDKGFWSW